MKQNDQLAAILESLFTVEDVSSLNARIDSCIEHLYDARKKPQTVLESFFSTAEISSMVQWSGSNMETGKPSDIQNVLEKIKKYILALPVLELTVAYTPSAKTERRIVEWCEDNIGTNVILKFRKDPSIVAGAVISYQGRMHDYSLEKKINELLPL